MSAITVTSVAGASLALHSCTSCGRHEWHRDGAALDRGSLLGVVRDRIAEGPAPRQGGTSRSVRARTAARTARAAELRRQLAGLTAVSGDDRPAPVDGRVPAAAGAALLA